MARKFLKLALFLGLLGGQLLSAPADELLKNFRHPPETARPWVYWYFMDGLMTREGMTADLEAMKRAGIGGAIFLEVNIGLPRGPVEFMSPQWQELLTHAAHEADRLGLQLALAAGPGWCGTGGPWVKPEKSMQHLVGSKTNVTGPSEFSQILPRPTPRLPYFGEGTLTPQLRAEWQNFYQDVAVVAYPTPDDVARIGDADEKALYYRDPFSSKPGVKPFLAAPAEFPQTPAEHCLSLDKAIDLTARLSPDGRLIWSVPPGKWTIFRFGRTVTGQTTRPAPVPGLGFESDKFDASALDAHFAAFCGKMISEIGPRKNHDRGLTTIHFDSWEMGSQNWSEQFRAEFKKRRGYDPLKYFPAYLGMVVDRPEITERFLWDLRLTAGELIVENHARHLRELSHRNGLNLSIEPYDLNPAGDLELGAEADVPMCEFWADGDGFNTSYSCIEATSIGHTHGKSIIGAESFTGEGRTSWLRNPSNMKDQADWALAIGINRLTFHRYQHEPWTNVAPGLTMSSYGTQYERTQTWWEMSGPWHDYLARCQYILRQGLPVADILYLTPEGAPNVFLPPATALAGKANMPDRRGYNFDGIDPATLTRDATVRDGKIVLPDGMSYRVLVLPRLQTMTPVLLSKIRDLAKAGAIIMGSPPLQSPSLVNYPQCDAEVKKIAAEIWPENSESPSKAETALYPTYESVSNQLERLNIPPDFNSASPIRYNHRHLKDADIYLLSNPATEKREVACEFRIAKRQPEIWDPINCKTRFLPNWDIVGTNVTRLSLAFEPHQSYFVVFRKKAHSYSIRAGMNFPDHQKLADLTGAWKLSFPAHQGAPDEITLPQLGSWTDQSNSGVKYFSGTATYEKVFSAPQNWLIHGSHLVLDLGDVEVMAQVTLNGHAFETLWCTPYQIDVSSAIKAGQNILEVKVVNLWPNRMIGDAQVPDDTKRNGPFAANWPQWLLDGKSSPTGRITWASYQPFNSTSPLLPSGLLGPVTLQSFRP